ncbi:fructose-6-phosphate aldolase [Candidatus Dependentiae bacterium]|nr:MAG: fructose-6-phosphate aldolase [Candidatus Dependentiae bacterium]
MLIFLDTIDLKAIEKFVQLGIVDGITTNPSLFLHATQAPIKIIKEIIHMFPHGIINVEITEQDHDKAYIQAVKIRELGNNVVVKIPAHDMYLPLIAQLIKKQIPINITLVFSVSQAVLMGKMGVQYISPFVGRLYDNGFDGIEILKNIIQSFALYGFSTKVLAASLRTIDQVNKAIELGVASVTLAPSLLEEICCNQLTEQGIQKFAQDWQAQKENLFI